MLEEGHGTKNDLFEKRSFTMYKNQWVRANVCQALWNSKARSSLNCIYLTHNITNDRRVFRFDCFRWFHGILVHLMKKHIWWGSMYIANFTKSESTAWEHISDMTSILWSSKMSVLNWIIQRRQMWHLSWFGSKPGGGDRAGLSLKWRQGEYMKQGSSRFKKLPPKPGKHSDEMQN